MVLFADLPVIRPSTLWADYSGIYSAEHSVGVIGALPLAKFSIFFTKIFCSFPSGVWVRHVGSGAGIEATLNQDPPQDSVDQSI